MAEATEEVNGTSKTSPKTKAKLVGEVVLRPLKSVKPNPWNPNRMTPAERESLRHGFETDGWLASHSLLIWGTDEKGAKQDIIIDGEQKWTVARDAGLSKGPMVFLNGLSEAEAKKLTIKMNQKRGHWDSNKLEDLLRGLEASGEELSAIDLGFGEEALMQLLATAPIDMPVVQPDPTSTPADAAAPAIEGTPAPANGSTPATAPAAPAAPEAQTRMVQLYLDSVTQPSFLEDCQKLTSFYGTKTVTDTVLEAVKRARAALDAS